MTDSRLSPALAAETAIDLNRRLSELADQTRLIALCAAIQAAHAEVPAPGLTRAGT